MLDLTNDHSHDMKKTFICLHFSLYPSNEYANHTKCHIKHVEIRRNVH